MTQKLNSYFNFNGENGDNSNEQALIDGFVTETIQQTGVPVKYMPRTLVKEDKLYGEDVLSLFDTNAFDIEAYMETFDSFEGDGELLSDWGVSVKDMVKLRFSRTRFKEEAAAASITHTRPEEGDLIYLPLANALFEIKYVTNKEQFFPNGVLPSFVITCEKFDYSMETIATGDPAIDIVSDLDYPEVITPGFADNDDIQNESDNILVFDENSPFGNN